MNTTLNEEEHGFIRIRGVDVPVRTLMLDQSTLKFFVDNPRIYSIVRARESEPDQEEIYTRLLDLEHVRELKNDIKVNGGLIDPLIVREGTLEVLEGNSRLAACRWLYKSVDPIAWAKVKCTLLPSDIDEKLVFALLGQYHVKGKKDWAPFEKAGFLYRRFRQHQEDIPTVAEELGMTPNDTRHLIEVYEFMQKHGDTDRDRWSHYDEFIKSRKVKKVREQFPNFDALFANKIQSGDIKRAVDVRDALPKICTGPPKNLKRFIEGKISFEEARVTAEDSGSDDPIFKRLHRFRQWFAADDVKEDILEAPKAVRDRVIYELKQINGRTKRLIQMLSEKETSDECNID